MSESAGVTITELTSTAVGVDAQGYRIEIWNNGIYFVYAPNGEGTEVPEEAVAGVLAELFRKFF